MSASFEVCLYLVLTLDLISIMLNFFTHKRGMIIVSTSQVYYELCWNTVCIQQTLAIIKQYHQC